MHKGSCFWKPFGSERVNFNGSWMETLFRGKILTILNYSKFVLDKVLNKISRINNTLTDAVQQSDLIFI